MAVRGLALRGRAPLRPSGISQALGAVVAASMTLACSPPHVLPPPIAVPPPTAEAISLLGDTLWSVPMTIESAQERLARLQYARELASSHPENANNQINLIRRTAGIGRLREAIRRSTQALELHNLDPRLYLLRGELLLKTRRLDYAVRDFQMAGRLTIRDSTIQFYELEGVGLVGVGVRFSIWLQLGQALFALGQFRQAALALAECVDVATNVDEAAQAAVWLALAYQRDGRAAEALAVASAWKGDARIVLHDAEHHLLLAWKGAISPDSLARSAMGFPGAEALHTLAAGVRLLMEGHKEEAIGAFEMVRSIGIWTEMPYLAAEAELARLTGPGRSRG